MSPHFNLLDEPWIRVTRLGGETDEVSLLSLFREAEDIEGIHGEIASQDVAILRLLLAICHRTMGGPPDLATWREYWQTPGKLGTEACTYLERFRDRFDLRDPQRPFFQVAGLKSASKQRTLYPLSEIVADVPKPGKLLFSQRLLPPNHPLSWPEAARWLIHLHAFDGPGTHSLADGDENAHRYAESGYLGKIGATYIRGGSLFQTLMFNTVVTGRTHGMKEVDTALDSPPWEREQDDAFGKRRRLLRGPATCFTWQSRRAILHGNEIEATSLFFSNGDQADLTNGFTAEPMTSWSLRNRTLQPYKPPAGLAAWRLLPAFIPQWTTGDSPNDRAPGVVEFHSIITRQYRDLRQPLLPLHITSVTYDNDHIKDMIDDELVIPERLLTDDNARLIAVVRDSMESTYEVVDVIKSLAANIDRAAGGNETTSRSAKGRAETGFLHAINERFPLWLIDLETATPDAARDEWRALLRREAFRQQKALTSQVPETAFAGRGEGANRMDVSTALFFFSRALNLAVPSPEQPPSPTSTRERTDA